MSDEFLNYRPCYQLTIINSMQPKPIHIDVRRSDPISGVLSATLHIVGSMIRAVTDVAFESYQVYKLGRSQELIVDGEPKIQRGEASTGPSVRPNLISESIHSLGPASKQKRHQLTRDWESHGIHDDGESWPESNQSIPNSNSHRNGNHIYTVRIIFTVSAKSAGKLAFLPVKGLMIDIPLAAAEGMRALPRLYGDNGYEPGVVTGWKSGAAIAVKSFTHGVQEGIRDIFVRTYAGKKKDGAKGVARGLGEGVLSLTMKTGAAALGLVAYPCQGLYKSAYTAMHTMAREKVDQAKEEEGQWLLENRQDATSEVRNIILGFLQARDKQGK